MNFAALSQKHQKEQTAEEKKLTEIYCEANQFLAAGEIAKAEDKATQYNKISEEINHGFFIKINVFPEFYNGVAKKTYKLGKSSDKIEGKLLYGDTFKHKEAIKAAGGKFRSFDKCWEVPAEKFEELFQLVNS